MRTIYKYKLNITDDQTVYMPAHASILSVGLDPSKNVCVWALVETENKLEPRVFVIAGTGNPFPGTEAPRIQKFIGTVVQDPCVWHIFEEMTFPFR